MEGPPTSRAAGCAQITKARPWLRRPSALLALSVLLLVVADSGAGAMGLARFQEGQGYDETYDEFDDPSVGGDSYTGDPYADPYGDPYADPYGDPYADPYGDPYADPYGDPYADSSSDPYADECWDPMTGMPCGFDPDTGFFEDPDGVAGLGSDDTIPFPDDPFTDDPFSATDPAPAVLSLERPLALARATAGRGDVEGGEITSLDDLEDDDVAAVAAGRLALAVDSLAELGAFARDEDPFVTEIIRQIRSRIPADGLDDDGYRAELGRFAEDFPELVGRLTSQGVPVSEEVLLVAATLDEDVLSELAAGSTGFLPPIEWLDALADLAARDGAAPNGPADDLAGEEAVMALIAAFAQPAAPADGLAAPTNETTITSDTVTSTEAVAAAPASEGGSQSAIGIALAGAAAVVLAIVASLAILLGRRRRRDPEAAPPQPGEADTPAGGADNGATVEHQVSLTDLLDASRRMTASLDRSSIAAIAVEEAKRLVDAEGGLIVAREIDGDRTLYPLHHEPAVPFDLDQMDSSSLQRVVETGRSASTVATAEPILVEVPMAVASVAIVADGTVVGALMVIRVATRPFGSAEVDALGTLASLVGSALAAAATHDSANELADVEPMTGLKNRRRLDRDLGALDPTDRVAYVMVDVDHFKNFNDVNGHAAGDDALRSVAATLQSNVRPTDIVYRYGGEEFCVLLPGATSAEAADIAERARAAVEASAVPGAENQPNGRLTISVGVADTAAGDLDDLVERADAALYRAKDSGRNQVRIEHPPTPAVG